MDAETGRAGAKSLLDIVAGIETGVIGGAVMLGWFAVITPMLGEPWWLFPNLLASGFYGSRHVLEGPGAPTFVGAAVHIAGAGVVGAVNGVLTPGGRLFGLAIATAWYLLCYGFLWKRIAPGMYFHPPQALLISAWFVYGSILGWHRYFAERASR